MKIASVLMVFEYTDKENIEWAQFYQKVENIMKSLRKPLEEADIESAHTEADTESATTETDVDAEKPQIPRKSHCRLFQRLKMDIKPFHLPGI